MTDVMLSLVINLNTHRNLQQLLVLLLSSLKFYIKQCSASAGFASTIWLASHSLWKNTWSCLLCKNFKCEYSMKGAGEEQAT